MKIKVLSLFILLALPVLLFAQDELTITTYYPSPYGSYNELQLVAHSSPITSCTDQTKGTMYLDSDDNLIYVCQGLSEGWKPLSGYWAPSPTNPANIYNINKQLNGDAGNVGIGTNNPQASLEIQGDAILIPRHAADPLIADSVNGMIYYNTTTNTFRIFENSVWRNMHGWWIPNEITVSIQTDNGNWGGYIPMYNACRAMGNNYHPCAAWEIIGWVGAGNALNTQGWLVGEYYDCIGWTTSSSGCGSTPADPCGTTWWNQGGTWHVRSRSCSTTLPVLCCR